MPIPGEKLYESLDATFSRLHFDQDFDRTRTSRPFDTPVSQCSCGGFIRLNNLKAIQAELQAMTPHFQLISDEQQVPFASRLQAIEMPRTYMSGDTTVISHQGNKSRLTEYAEKSRGSKVDNVYVLETQLAATAAAHDVTAILGLTQEHGKKGLMRYRSLVPCWAGSLCVGTALGYALPAGRTLDAAAHRGILEVPHRQILWFGSMLSLGAVFGSLAGALMAQLSGRRRSLYVAGIGMVASWLVIGCSRSMYYYCGARFFCGFLAGVVSIVVPAQVAEIAPVMHRGMHGAVHQLAVALGILYVYFLGRFLDWEWLAVLCAPPAVALLLLTRSFALESPRWILQMGDSLGALNTLAAARASKSQADIEFDAIQAVLPKYRTPVAHYLLALLLMVTQQLSGINSVIISTVSLGPESDVSAPSTDSAILLALLQALFVVGFSAGLGPVPWVLAAELVPLRGTGLEFGSVCAANWAGSFVTANFVATTTTTRMIAVSLWLYGFIAITGGLISFALLPDTDCMSIEDILLIDPDERARRKKIQSTDKGKLHAPPGSVRHAHMKETSTAAAAQPQSFLTKSMTPDRRSSDATQTRSQDSAVKKPRSSRSRTPTEVLTAEKPGSDVSQVQSKAPDEVNAVSERRPRDIDSRKSPVASQKSTGSKSSAGSGRSGHGTRKKKGAE
ncbi:solute carrier family 2, facilitated glucose transporter member 8-like [Rhipicephalus sanguineus]|uniref:solute carrier family 2, facilitated glucose transporter member 8-like n=1 Tax=Rhipicephalus sanguineus TaxID=34632 RepID=UPI0020C58699|nr:solute carrier family 2, facilitated glucose transporter member 8-like [Rhipicephalus sanguineus]